MLSHPRAQDSPDSPGTKLEAASLINWTEHCHCCRQHGEFSWSATSAAILGVSHKQKIDSDLEKHSDDDSSLINIQWFKLVSTKKTECRWPQHAESSWIYPQHRTSQRSSFNPHGQTNWEQTNLWPDHWTCGVKVFGSVGGFLRITEHGLPENGPNWSMIFPTGKLHSVQGCSS